jgi:hypothetical protein
MEPTGLHLLLTYACLYECDHCFVWGGPTQTGTMTARDLDRILDEAATLDGVRTIYFEGGEPFLYHAVLLHGVRQAHRAGHEVGIVTNGYWGNSREDALLVLGPFAGLVKDLSLSLDSYHGEEEHAARIGFVREAARELGIPVNEISVARPAEPGPDPGKGQLPPGTSPVRFRGRAARELAPRAPSRPWEEFTTCEPEDLRTPSRVHIDPFGYVHLCQGIAIGNLYLTPLAEICRDFDPDRHPIVGPLLAGGPAELARVHDLHPDGTFADGCHLCFETRCVLRPRFPAILAPDAMYGPA